MIRLSCITLILIHLTLSQKNKVSQNSNQNNKNPRGSTGKANNKGPQNALKEVTVIGDNVYKSIDDLSISPSSYLINDVATNLTAAWPVKLQGNNSIDYANTRNSPSINGTGNLTDTMNPNFMPMQSEENVEKKFELSISSPYLGIEDLIIQTSIPDENGQIKIYSFKDEMNVDVSISQSVIPQQAYVQYQNTTYNTSAIADCSFINGGIIYDLKETTGDSDQTRYFSFGPVIIYIRAGKILLSFNGTESTLIDSLSSNDSQKLSTAVFQEISILNEASVPFLIAADSTNNIYLFNIAVTKKVQFRLYSIFASSNINQALKLSLIKFRKNVLAIQTSNSTLEVFNLGNKANANSTNTSAAISSFITFSLGNNYFSFVASIPIDGLNDFSVNTKTIYTITSKGFVIIAINDLTQSVYLSHPSMLGFSVIKPSSEAMPMLLASANEYIGITIKNDGDTIKEFYLELVIQNKDELNPLINKVFLSSSQVSFDIAVSDNRSVVLFDKLSKRFLTWVTGVPNTISAPIYQIFISDLSSVDLSQLTSNLSLVSKNIDDTSLAYLLSISNRVFELSNLGLIDFSYTCDIRRENVEVPILASMLSLCSRSDDYCIYNTLAIRPFDGPNIGLIVGLIIGIVFAIACIIIGFIIYRRRKYRRQALQEVAPRGHVNIDIAEAPTPNENSRPLKESSTKSFEVDKNEQVKI